MEISGGFNRKGAATSSVVRRESQMFKDATLIFQSSRSGRPYAGTAVRVLRPSTAAATLSAPTTPRTPSAASLDLSGFIARKD